jgi:hypothetical protein
MEYNLSHLLNFFTLGDEYIKLKERCDFASLIRNYDGGIGNDYNNA